MTAPLPGDAPRASDRRFIVVGPTASGKGRVAVEVARRLGGEVISADSMKVYRGMDVGTAKPGIEERRGVPFHLFDLRHPAEPMSVATWIEHARAAEAEIRSRGRIPVFEGGTALYVRGLTEGVFEGPPADPALRERLAAEADQAGEVALHERLRAIDPRTAARLHPNDRRRVIRALEVFEKTGRPISSFQSQWTGEVFGGEEPRAGRILVGLQWEREALYRRIDSRVDRMFARGLVEECRRLLADPRGVGREAAQALGYREVFDWIAAGERASLADVIDAVKRHTRRFSRRQMTFLRHFADVEWLPVDEATDPRALADALVARHFPRP